MLKHAYEFGVQLALQDAGLTKTAGDDSAWVPGAMSYLPIPFAGPIGGAITAPEGKGWAGFGGSLLGQMAGIPVGAVAGGAGGATLGALIGALARRPGAGAQIGGLLGAGLGGVAGHGLGAAKGYRMAVGD